MHPPRIRSANLGSLRLFCNRSQLAQLQSFAELSASAAQLIASISRPCCSLCTLRRATSCHLDTNNLPSCLVFTCACEKWREEQNTLPFLYDLLRLTCSCLLMRQATLTPDQAIDVLSGRVGIIKKINSDVADWLAVRRDKPYCSKRQTKKEIGTTQSRGSICHWPAQACKPSTTRRGCSIRVSRAVLALHTEADHTQASSKFPGSALSRAPKTSPPRTRSSHRRLKLM